MIGNVGAAKQLRRIQTAAEHEEILKALNNIDPNPLTPTLSPSGRGRRAPRPMSGSEHISPFLSATEQQVRLLGLLRFDDGGELPLPAGERVGVRGLGR
jgi:hypothetical protein